MIWRFLMSSSLAAARSACWLRLRRQSEVIKFLTASFLQRPALAGIAPGGYTSGALAAGVMAISCFAGRSYDHFSDLECIRANMFPMARELCDRFEAEYGAQGGTCTAVQTKLLGKSFDLYRGDREGFAQSGGHLTACPSACGKAAVWTIEILHEHGRI